MNTPAAATARAAFPHILFITGIFYFNFLVRVVLAPLMVPIEAELGLSHAQAGRIFLFISAGVSAGLLGSGFVSGRITHRRTIAASSVLMGGFLVLASMCRDPLAFNLSLLGMGVAGGLYLPSGIAAITGLVRSGSWGRVIAVHELAPNAAFITAPLLAEAMMAMADWRTGLGLVGGCQAAAGVLFLAGGRGGNFPGQAPSPDKVAGILARPQFWIMVLFFSLAVGVSLGSYTMVPLYLVAERGFERELANTLLSVSRISGLGMAFVAGWLTDRLGPKQTMAVYFLLAGAFTVLLGLAPGNLVAVPVLLQPLLVGVFFPAGFTAVSRVFDQSLRSLAVGFITPVSATLGAGLVPAALGWAGDRGSFAAGFVVLGCALLAGAAALKLLSIPASGRDGE